MRVFATGIGFVVKAFLGIADKRFRTVGNEAVVRFLDTNVFKYLLFQIPVNRALSAEYVFRVIGIEHGVRVSFAIVVDNDHRHENATEI